MLCVGKGAACVRGTGGQYGCGAGGQCGCGIRVNLPR